jgi:hypothetical protein
VILLSFLTQSATKRQNHPSQAFEIHTPFYRVCVTQMKQTNLQNVDQAVSNWTPGERSTLQKIPQRQTESRQDDAVPHPLHLSGERLHLSGRPITRRQREVEADRPHLLLASIKPLSSMADKPFGSGWSRKTFVLHKKIYHIHDEKTSHFTGL